MNDNVLQLPSQSQMMLPLLASLLDAGGVAKPGSLYDEIAARLNLDDTTRNATVSAGAAGNCNAFERAVRWTRQSAVMKGLISRERRGRWELTEKANAQLKNIVRGAILTAFQTERGFYLVAHAADAIACISRSSVALIMSSPPYPLVTGKAYQYREDRSTQTWLDNMLRLFEGWLELLSPTGSVMLNLGPVWKPGVPVQSLYVERLLTRLEDALNVHLLQEMSWHSPNKLGALEWVGIRRLRVKPSVEKLLWLSPNPFAKANNKHVLTPYSKSAKRSFANPVDGEHKRPSGFTFGPSSFVEGQGAIPPSLIVATNCASRSKYRLAERAAGREPHPALMPDALAEFGIKLATDVGDLVYDPFGGAGTVGLAAERLDRRWILNDRSRYYSESAQINFEANGFATELLAA